jgi:hypothetical protein
MYRLNMVLSDRDGCDARDEGGRMPKMVVTHNVVDVDRWLKGKSERAAAIGNIGGVNVVDQVAQDGSNAVAISCDVDDVEAMLAILSSPPADMAATMESHGVVPPLTVYVER